ncbi:MAG: hypothetical protein ACREO5_13825, partial [Candidatus Binatia bacterium]
CAVLTVACWRFKTDNYDLPTIGKMKRQRDRARGIKRAGGRKLGWKKFDGTPVHPNRRQV